MSEQIPQPNKKIEVIPPYEFRKGTKLSDEEKKALSDYLSGLTVEWKGNAKPREVRGGRLFEISRLINNICLWAKKELGVSLALKKSDISWQKIKFYDSEEFNKMTKAGELGYESLGASKFPTNDTVILEQKNERETLRNTNHELIHALGRAVISAQKRGDGEPNIVAYRSGYGSYRKNTFLVFNEVMTEMINLESLAHYQKMEGVDYITGCKVGYFVAVIFFDMLIAKLAEKSGLSGQDLRRDLYTGYFTGEFKYLNLFNKYLGDGALKKIASLPGDAFDLVGGVGGSVKYTDLLFKDLLKESYLDYDEFIKRVEKYNAGEDEKLYCGVEISKNIKSPKT